MRLLFGSLFTFLVAAAVGLGATYLAMTKGIAFGALSIGTWKAFPKSGTADIDPYARATIVRTGQLPTGLGDGVSFSTQTDDAGKPLDGRCEVVLSGVTPPARFWTITLYNPDGSLVANSLNRYGYTSQEIVRHADGSFQLTVSPRASAGNWLPTGGTEHYVLMLRFYDTAVGVSTRTGREAPMPSVTTRSCP